MQPKDRSSFSRRTVLASIDLINLFHADLTRFLLDLGPDFPRWTGGEGLSIRKRLNELIGVYDMEPHRQLDSGELLADVLVTKAAAGVEPVVTYPWSTPSEEPAKVLVFRRALARDGFTIVDGTLRRVLPVDLGIAEAEDETTRLLKVGPFKTAAGHLEQALDAHGRGDWAAANSMIRSFYEALLDEIAIAIDASTAGPNKGEARRARLGKEGFLRTDLNEWSDDGKNFVNGLMKRLHPHGSHPGLSDEEDSTFRLHIVLLTARFFLARYEAGRPT